MSFIGKTASVFGVVGLSAIATLGVVESAEAAKVVLGSDYWVTQGSSSFNFPGFGTVNFVGDPIDQNQFGKADTIVERKEDCTFDNNGSCTTPIQIVALSLKSKNPVNGFDVFVNLDENNASPMGTLTINENKTFSSNFIVNFTATFKNAGEEGAIIVQKVKDGMLGRLGLQLPGDADERQQRHVQEQGAARPDLVAELANRLQERQAFDVAHSAADLADDEMDFFAGVKEVVDENGDTTIEIVVIEHDASGAGHHDVAPNDVPEPLTILGSATALGFGALLKKQSSRKRNKKNVS